MSADLSSAAPTQLVIASRASALAIWQAHYVQQMLAVAAPKTRVTIHGMTTEGDRVVDRSLARAGGKGLFVKELEEALAAGRADLAVHSMKDVPMSLPPGYVIAAVSAREDPRDAFVSARYSSLDDLPHGARIGTSSLRRSSQLQARYPHLRVAPIRGNVPTRIKKLDAGEFDGIILAAAGLKRLALADRITELMSFEASLPAPGQGALAIECRWDRADIVAVLGPINHAETAACVTAERAFSRALSGNCQLPLAAYAEVDAGQLRLRGLVAAPDGQRIVQGEISGTLSAGEDLGRELAARLRDQGAGDILAGLAR